MTRMSRKTAEIFARRMAPEDAKVFLEAQEKDAARSAGSELAQLADHAFMDWARAQHRAARDAGVIGRIRHVGPPVRFVGRGLCEPTGKGPADFQGNLSKKYSSLPLAVEAKTRAGRLALSEIPEHQRVDLDECIETGGVGVLLYEHRDGLTVTQFAVPWRAVPWRSVRKGAGPSIGPEECAPWRVRGLYWLELMEGGRCVQG